MAGPPWNYTDDAERCKLVNAVGSGETTSFDIQTESSDDAPTQWPTSDFILAILDRANDKAEIVTATSLSTSGGSSETVSIQSRGATSSTSALDWSAGDKVRLVQSTLLVDNNPRNIITSQSDLIAGDANGDPTRIAGSTTQDDVLKINSSGLPTFGPSPAGGAWSKISTTEVSSAQSSVDFTSGIDASHQTYAFILAGLTPDTNAELELRVSNDGGSTFESTSNYAFHSERGFTTTQNGIADFGSVEDSFRFVGQIGTATGETSAAIIYMWTPNDSSLPTFFVANQVKIDQDNETIKLYLVGAYEVTETVDAIRFFMSSGNIESGTLSLFGITQ